MVTLQLSAHSRSNRPLQRVVRNPRIGQRQIIPLVFIVFLYKEADGKDNEAKNSVECRETVS